MKKCLLFLLYFIFFHSSNSATEHSASDAGGINDYFMRSANAKAGATATAASLRQRFLDGDFTAYPKTLPRAAPRREPETIMQDESEEGEDVGRRRPTKTDPSREHFVQVRGPNPQRRIQLR